MMARKADKDRVRADIAPPDYQAGIDIIRDRINAKRLQQSKISGEVSGLWDQIEKLGINKEGARIFMKLDGYEEAERNDVLRTIQAMAAAAGWDKSGDMIDQAQGSVVQFPAPAAKAGDKPAKPAKGTGPKSEPEVAKAKAAAAGDADLNPADVLDRGEYIQVMADHIAANSTLDGPEAHACAVEVFEALPQRDPNGPRTKENAVANAQAEVDSWPEEGTDEGGTKH